VNLFALFASGLSGNRAVIVHTPGCSRRLQGRIRAADELARPSAKC
jgi:hypothetical protein